MKCSECSQAVKPVVVCDIDGTLADYHTTFTTFAVIYWDKSEPKEPWDGTGEFEDYLDLTKDQYRQAKLAFRQGGNKRNLPVYPGAWNFSDRVRNAGAELWLATQRPWMLHDAVDPDTQWWLRINDIPYDYLIYGEDKYAEVLARCDRKRVVMLLDDLAEQYRESEKYFPGLAVQIARPHNTSPPCMMSWRAANLGVAQHMADFRIRRWKERYGAERRGTVEDHGYGVPGVPGEERQVQGSLGT